MKILSGVNFDGASYPVMQIDVFPDTDKAETVLVSIDRLGHRLVECMENVGPAVAEAIELDNKICYFLTGEEFNLPEEEIRKIVENALS